MCWLLVVYYYSSLCILLFLLIRKKYANENILKKVSQKFGGIKKIVSSLHCKTNNNSNMLQVKLHIETANRFSPMGDYCWISGACMLLDKV